MHRRLLSVLGVLVAPLALVLGIWAGGHPETLPGFVRDALVDDSEARTFDQALDLISEDFYKRPDRRKLLDASLSGAVRSLDDRFSHYFDPEAFQAFHEATSGAFEGVGMSVSEVPRGLRVLKVFPGGPAARAGIRRGDLIVEADGKSLRGKPSQESVALIKGPSGTRVRLTIVTDGRRRVETLRREEVTVPVVDSRLERRDGRKYGHVSLASFTSGSHGELRKAIDRLLERGAEGIVLDLRGNGGGLLDEAVLVSSLFIGDGTIVTTRGRNRRPQTYEATGRPVAEEQPVVVLVDGASASASEIVTGALQERRDAPVVGTRTFGKGVFQQIQRLPNGGALDLTVGEYFTPEGRNLGPRDGKRGIVPDVRARDRRATEKVDEALERALEELAEQPR